MQTSSFLHKLAAVLLVVAMALPSGLAQQAEKPGPGYVFRVNSDLVLVNVVARDKSGALVRDLKREDFTIQEDGKTQQIQSFDISKP